MKKLFWLLPLFLMGCGSPTGGHLVRVTSPQGTQWVICEETARIRFGYGDVSFDIPAGRVVVYGGIVEPIGTCPTNNP